MPWPPLGPAGVPVLADRRLPVSLGTDMPQGLRLAGATAARAGTEPPAPMPVGVHRLLRPGAPIEVEAVTVLG